MFTLFYKEINGFFTSLTGYIVILVFLVINSLFIWVFPGELNVLDSGYASLETLFIIAPWVFLFLIPAITMRSFAEEERSGTLQLLLTRPLSDLQIVTAKYLAALSLALIALVPCLLYFFSVYLLGNPLGNIDTGGTWGSFIGLFFLAAIYAGIGVFCSSLTSNMIISFILSVVLSVTFYIGFEALSVLPVFNAAGTFIINLGINEHYKSISRGVIDSRDIVYYLAVVSLFILATKTKLSSRQW
ncbi:MAG: gliding motility-associated ABC transporter permease subunit GldF [Bacteroidales bacterium]|nr:gliding motility-associated ABC transporter permease subunit GldF [Bacteroidales bacterium]